MKESRANMLTEPRAAGADSGAPVDTARVRHAPVPVEAASKAAMWARVGPVRDRLTRTFALSAALLYLGSPLILVLVGTGGWPVGLGMVFLALVAAKWFRRRVRRELAAFTPGERTQALTVLREAGLPGFALGARTRRQAPGAARREVVPAESPPARGDEGVPAE